MASLQLYADCDVVSLFMFTLKLLHDFIYMADPRLTDYETLFQNIHDLKAGKVVKVPIYDFKLSSCTVYRSVIWSAQNILRLCILCNYIHHRVLKYVIFQFLIEISRTVYSIYLSQKNS